jgi:xylulokinase
MDTELVTVNTTEGAAYGAGLLAGVGVGVWPDVDAACDAAIQVVDRVSPHPDQTARYDEFYAVYRGLYGALKRTFDRETALVS